MASLLAISLDTGNEIKSISTHPAGSADDGDVSHEKEAPPE